MSDSFFGLRKRPFLLTPTLDRYFPAEGIEQAYQTVSRVIERAEGPAVIIGGAGLGKSLLCLRIADAWQSKFDVILLSSSKICSRRALLQSLLFELRLPYRDMAEGELRLSLMERLQQTSDTASEGLLLIVDEAQSLNVKLLEELRLLTNLAIAGTPRVRLVLAGTLRLDEHLGHPRLESLHQRIATRCYLKALTADEVSRYIRHKVELCGVDIGSVFTDEAIRAIYRASDGVPRLIDQIADHALRFAESQRQCPVSASLVEQTWAEIQQLPTPWNDSIASNPAPSSFVEFGTLDEEDTDFDRVEHFDTDTESTTHRTATPRFEHTIQADTEAGRSAEVNPSSSASFHLPAETTEHNESSTHEFNASTFGSFEFASFDSPSSEWNQPQHTSNPTASSVEPAQPSVAPIQVATNDYQFKPGDISPRLTAALQAVQLKLTANGKAKIVPVTPPVLHDTKSTFNDFKSVFGSDFTDETVVAPRASSQPSLIAIQETTTEGRAKASVESHEVGVQFHDASETFLQAYLESRSFDSLADTSALATELQESTPAMPLEETIHESVTSLHFETTSASQQRDLHSATPNSTVNTPKLHGRPGAQPANYIVRQGLGPNRSHVLSFASLTDKRHTPVTDDRDLLVIEDDVEVSQKSTSDAPAAGGSNAYIQLFSRLRG